jgi:hypothetical protein
MNLDLIRRCTGGNSAALHCRPASLNVGTREEKDNSIFTRKQKVQASGLSTPH